MGSVYFVCVCTCTAVCGCGGEKEKEEEEGKDVGEGWEATTLLFLGPLECSLH